jgi:hypothetical protein
VTVRSASRHSVRGRPARLHAVEGCGTLGYPRSRDGRRQLRRRRLAGLLRFAVFLLLIFIAVWAGVRVAHAGPDASVYTGHEYVVRGGDTLWSIASREYGQGVDVRRAVFAIREASGLDASSVRPGDKLVLPFMGE